MIDFKSISKFPKGTLYNRLVDTYSSNDKRKEAWNNMWEEYDDFFFNNLDLADKYGFITVLDGEPMGHISWDQ